MSKIENLSWASPIDDLYKGKTKPKSLENLKDAHVYTLYQLINIFPYKYYPVKLNPQLHQCVPGDYIRIKGSLTDLRVRPIFKRKLKMAQVSCTMVIGFEKISLTWFNAYPPLRQKVETLCESQEQTTLEGVLSFYRQQYQLTNPRFVSEDEAAEIELVYPSMNKVTGKYIKGLIEKIPVTLWDKLPTINSRSPSLSQAYKVVHNLNDKSETPIADCLERIKYQEFLIDQLKIIARRNKRNSIKIPPITFTEEQIAEVKSQLSFQLTVDQEKSLQDIINDLQSGHPLTRMIQGDVGCGKTAVAFIVSSLLASQKYQVAFMCPTETLAAQHYHFFQSHSNLSIGYLASSLSAKEKKIVSEKIHNGEYSIVIGTHSLFQKSIEFKNLGLCIIDEQHKFGVQQRIDLVAKSTTSHCLLMSATPIPRSLQLTQFGDLDISSIKTMPSQHRGYKTRVVETNNFENYLSFIKTRLELHEQGYIVLPNIEASEYRSKYSIGQLLEQYRQWFPETHIQAIHGQLKSDEQKEVIQKFRDNKIQILISTSIIEVGIHVPNATFISIYHPEYFGLSSLHQLRGRVGRDEKPGFCFLIAENSLTLEQKNRLKEFEKISDGFKISELDLKLRGSGDLFGIDQSGHEEGRRISHIVDDKKILDDVIEDINSKLNPETIHYLQNFYGIMSDPLVMKSV